MKSQKHAPSTNPTTPLMNSNTLVTRSRARPKADWKAERMPLRMPERISKREETRFSRPEMREDIFILVSLGWLVGCWILILGLKVLWMNSG